MKTFHEDFIATERHKLRHFPNTVVAMPGGKVTRKQRHLCYRPHKLFDGLLSFWIGKSELPDKSIDSKRFLSIVTRC